VAVASVMNLGQHSGELMKALVQLVSKIIIILMHTHRIYLLVGEKRRNPLWTCFFFSLFQLGLIQQSSDKMKFPNTYIFTSSKSVGALG
jgi:hypothetical protein